MTCERDIFFNKLKCERSTPTLSAGIKYFMYDLVCEVNYCSFPAMPGHKV